MNQRILEFTGERFTPECVREIAYEHWHRYAWASSLVQDKVVLDAACGEGYGSALLAQGARSVLGIDCDAATIEHAQQRYTQPNLRFACADVLDMPVEPASVDVVVSFETLEHLSNHDGLLQAFRRVLKADGLLLLSSPDRQQYSEALDHQNPFHAKELDRPELEALLSRHFPAWQLMGQKLGFTSMLWPLSGSAEGPTQCLQQRADGTLQEQPVPSAAAKYFIAVAAASTEALPALPALSLFDDQAESIYQHYNEEVRRHIQAGQLLAEREAEIAALKQQARSPRPWWRWWW